MAIAQTFHSLTEVDLAALSKAQYTPELIGRLEAAQFSRNALLFEAIHRAVAAAGDTETANIIDNAALLLSGIQKERPDVVRRLLVLPQFGLWAADCLIGLRPAAGRSYIEQQTRHELGYAAAFAATAGLLAGHTFQLRMPLRDGIAYLPSLAGVPLDGSPGLAWAQISSEGDGSAVLAAGGHQPVTFKVERGKAAAAEQIPVSRLRARSRGVLLSVALDGSDPFLARLGPVSPSLSRESVQAWRRGLRSAWQMLVRENQPLASALATGLTTLVPLRQPAQGPSVSAASGWAWGAIALTLPPDPLTFAETLIHEFQHLVLSAIADIVPIAKSDGEDLFYSPWRDDPRPFSSVLQGAYAFFGVTGFWRSKRHSRHQATRQRAEANFALRRRNVSDALEIVAHAGKLTDTGQVFVDDMKDCLAEWLAESVPAKAEDFACEVTVEHEMRWRLANLSPDPEAIDSLARGWLATPSFVPRPPGIPTTLTRSPRSALTDRSALIERQFSSAGGPIPAAAVISYGPGDLAFVRGDMADARTAYIRRLGLGADHDAWVGLVLVLQRLGSLADAWRVAQHIEVVAAVSDRISAMAGENPDPQALLMWASRTWGAEE